MRVPGNWAAAGVGRADRSVRPSTIERHDFLFMRRVGASMFLLGSATLLATLTLPDPDTSDHTAITIIAVLLGFSAFAIAFVQHYRGWMVRFLVIYGIVLVSGLMAVVRPIGATPFFYLWPMLFSAYFFSRREVVLDLVIMWSTLGLALFIWSRDPMSQVTFVGVGVSVTLTAVVVTLLREHLTRVIGQLADASATDYLTGLLNRRAFDAELRRQIDRARRTGVALTLALFDLDHFKQINDSFGHGAGDSALCDFATLLRREQRSGDTLARIGGEEFAVVLFGVGLRQASTYAERIGRQLRHLTTIEGAVLSTSAGVAALSEGEQTPSALLIAADRALYAAKAAGRRRVAVWEQGTIDIGSSMDGVEQVIAGRVSQNGAQPSSAASS